MSKLKIVIFVFCSLLGFFSSQVFALTFKSGESINQNAGKEDWISSIRTELHDVEISGAKFAFVNDSFLSGLERFSFYKMPEYGWDTIGTDVGNNSGSTREMDCTRVMTNLQVEFEKKYDQPLYNLSCSQMYRVGLFAGGLEQIQNTLNHWSSQEDGYYDIKGNYDKVTYARQVSITHMATTYAIFYDLFDNRENINKFFKSWLLSNQTNRKPGEKICPFSNPRNYRFGENYVVDACGSNHWRAAISNIALGLRLNDKDLFISGVKHLEINLSMYDEKGIFVPYASRGWDAPGYAIDNDEHIGAVAFLLDMIGVNLYDVEMSSGQTVKELVEGHQKWLRDPTLAEEYILGTLSCNGGVCEMFDDFSQAGSLEQWKKDKDFDERNILLRSFDYQLKYHSDKYPNPLSLINFEEHHELGKDWTWGTNNAFPLIFATMSRDKRLDDYVSMVEHSHGSASDDDNSDGQESDIEAKTPATLSPAIEKLGLIRGNNGHLVKKDAFTVEFESPSLKDYRPPKKVGRSARYRVKFKTLRDTGLKLDRKTISFWKSSDGLSVTFWMEDLFEEYSEAREDWKLVFEKCGKIVEDHEFYNLEIPIKRDWEELNEQFECVAENVTSPVTVKLIGLLTYAANNIDFEKFKP